MDLHAQIMNLPVKPGLATANATDNQMVFYKLGHRDARHAAAELASAQSERIARLEEALRLTAHCLRWHHERNGREGRADQNALDDARKALEQQ